MNTEKQFFSLLRSGLWGQTVNASDFSENTDWQTIYRIAQKQTIIGIVYDGLSTLPVELQPEQKILYQWYSQVIKIEQANQLLNNVLVDIYELYQHNGITPVLLKGQGIAQCYINPLHRQCGDIDFYFDKDYNKANKLLQTKGLLDKDAIETYKHLNFKYRDVTIENHRHISHLYIKKYNHNLEKIVSGWYPSNVRYQEINKKNVALPPIQFDVLYIFLHLRNHFFEGGIGLRQLCDWVRLLHTNSNNYNPNILKINLKNLGLLDMWKSFGCIAVNYLGLVEQEMPFYSNENNIKAKKTLEYILNEGNFGKFSGKGIQPKGYIKRKWFNFSYQANRLKNIYSLYKKETRQYTMYYITDGIKRFIINK